MVPSKDDSNTSSLPREELNPLLNPVLAAHMGRWAEVYYTSLPENREQAVADLVRELEEELNLEGSSTESNQDFPGQSDQPTLACRQCGHANLGAQKFCGMCGFAVETAEEPMAGSGSAREEWNPPPPARECFAERVEELEADDLREALEASEQRVLPSSPSFATLFGGSERPERLGSGYRVYLGAALALLLSLLIYMTWRGSAAFRGGNVASSDVPLEEPPAMAGPDSAASPPATAFKSRTTISRPTASARTGQSTRETSSSKRQRALERAAAKKQSRADSSRSAFQSSGSEDLATAQKYLNGENGSGRDSREAANWLWKAVRKDNVTATLLLSELYVRGDGVTKNCEQARLLLDAAAHEGSASAAERLRHLPAFGCQ